MLSRVAKAVAMSLIVLASGLSLLVVPLASAAPAPAAAHPSATDQIYATDVNGYYRSSYTTGYNAGEVCFQAYDPSDTTAKVAIDDTNASRDGLSNPVWTVVANFSASATNDSYLYNICYLIPLSLLYGGWWNITISGASAGFATWKFFVNTYHAVFETTQDGYLPGHSGTLVYWVESDPNDGPYTYAAVKITAEYQLHNGTYATLPGTPVAVAAGSADGSFVFTIPTNARTFGYVFFSMWANVTTSSVNTTETDFRDVGIGNLTSPTVTLGTCPTGCASSSFQSGSTVFVNVGVWTSGPFSTIPQGNISISITYWNGGTSVTPTGAPTSLTSNASGEASFLFLATTSWFGTNANDKVNITISDPINPGLTHEWSNAPFTVRSVPNIAADLQVTLDQVQYFSGDMVNATWALGGVSSSVSSGWTVNQWFVYAVGSESILAWGDIHSNASTGTFHFGIPATYSGELEVYASTYNASEFLYSNTAYALVTAPEILLNPSEAYFLPGDTIQIAVTTEGSIFSSAQLYQSVVWSSGYQSASGNFTGSTITVTIPTTAAPSSVTVSVAAQSATLGVIATRSVTIYEGSGYQLLAGITTKSMYADGSFQPGQTVTVSYQLLAIGKTNLPKIFTIEVYPGSSAYYGSGYGSLYVQATSPSGTLSWTIPSNMPNGAQSVYVVVTSGTCVSSCGSATQFNVNVESSPSVLQMELGAGSGLTVGWLILLLIVIVVAIILVLMIRRVGRGGGGSRPEGMKPYEHPAASSSSSSASTTPDSPPGASGGSSTPPPMPSGPQQ